MRNRVRTTLLAAGTALVLGLTAAPFSAVPSFAATMTWTVTPGGAFGGTARPTTLSDPDTGFTVTCTSLSLSGSLRSGSGLSGSGIGTISKLEYTNCGASLSSSGFPWEVNFTSLSNGVVHGMFTGLHLTVKGGGSCTATIDGTGATADNGKLGFAWTLSTNKLKLVPSTSDLHFYTTSCLGMINNHDPAVFAATFTVSGHQHIS